MSAPADTAAARALLFEDMKGRSTEYARREY
jgi:hypothetical protein